MADEHAAARFEVGEVYNRTSNWQHAMWDKLVDVAVNADLDRQSKRQLLDLCCGSGRRTILALDLFPNVERVIAIDSEPSMVETAKRENPHPIIQYLMMTVEQLDELPDLRPDIVVAHWCLHWVAGKEKILRTVAERAVGNVDILISTCEALPSMLREIDQSLRRHLDIRERTPFHYLDFAGWQRFLERLGFVIRIYRRRREPHLVTAGEDFLRHWCSASATAAFYGRSYDDLDAEYRRELLAHLDAHYGDGGGLFWRFWEDTLFMVASLR